MRVDNLILPLTVSAYLTVFVLHNGRAQERDELRELGLMVKVWADNLGTELLFISESITRKSKAIDSFKQTRVVYEKGSKIMEDIADKIKVMMAEKEKAVKKIVEEVEYLSFYRKKPIFTNSTFDYYNADFIDNITSDSQIEEQLHEDRMEEDHQFRCDAILNKRKASDHFQHMKKDISHVALEKSLNEDELICQVRPYIEREKSYFQQLPLIYHPYFDEKVNFNFSSLRIATSVYDREDDILNDVRWSAALDLVYRENFREDPTLMWQYFAGISGFLRHYPAIKWSDDQYEKIYDFRTRAWYLEAISSPKDVIILLDLSGSMWQYKWITAKFLVNNILDTLGDNDYVNIYLFDHETRPLVDCFNYTLMQAHEENLRLLRESLNKHTPDSTGDMEAAFNLAFATLEQYRQTEDGAHCNQMIMFISEGIDYDYKPAELFETRNRTEYYTPVRVFTFLIGTVPSDEVQMVWIACANMGYYVNISKSPEIPEKVLKYLIVLSRPLNMNGIKPEPIWTNTYADLADRKLTNYLWQRYEGNQQRQIFVDYTREAYKQYGCIFEDKDESHFLLRPSHEYERYLRNPNFTYMSTVSLPAYDLRPGSTAILGVAGVDVPIDLFKKLTMPYKIGVNGYAFILTNNGLLLLHPDHRKEFKNNLKPTFNRVDMTEVELIDDKNEPRNFNKSLLEMREKIVKQMTGYDVFDVKVHVNHMRRILLGRRYYFYTKVGPFSLVVTIPDNYGFCKIKYDGKLVAEIVHNSKYLSGLRNTKNWVVHPEWLYCKYYGDQRMNFASPEEELLYFLTELEKRGWSWFKYCYPDLVNMLILDAKVTEWYEDRHNTWSDLMNKYQVTIVFLSTHSGLTRWKLNHNIDTEPKFIQKHNKAIDEVWYKRAVDYNYGNPRVFIYSVPFHGIDNKTLVTASNAIFRETGFRKSPVATIGYQFAHFTLESIFKKTTSHCGNKTCQHTCDSDELTCYVLDNNAYILVSDVGHTGEFIGNVRPDIMKHLVENGIYRKIRFVDYQDICYLDPPQPKSSPAPKNTSFSRNAYEVIKWLITTVVYLIKSAFGATNKNDNPCLRAITSEYSKRAIRKTLPTPCDRQRWLYTLDRDTYTNTNDNMFTTPDCLWPYIVQPIPNSNLILLVINGPCSSDVEIKSYPFTPEPKELEYNLSMPCYIATKNNYTRRQYIACINNNKRENTLNLNQYYCGVTW